MIRTPKVTIGSLRRAILIVSIATLLTQQGYSSVIASDPFSYPDNSSLGGQNGGAGAWTTPWTPDAPAVNGTWVVSNGVARSVGNENAALLMRRAVTVPNASTSNYYFRYNYMVPTLGGGEGDIFGGLTIGPGTAFGGSNILVYSQDAPSVSQPYHLRLRLAANGSLSASGSGAGPALTYGQNYTIVGRIEPNFTPGVTRATVWLTTNTAASMSELDPAYIQTTATFIFNPSSVSLYRESQNFTSVNYDNVILGTTFNDVIPEPTTLAFLAMSITALIARRSRCR